MIETRNRRAHALLLALVGLFIGATAFMWGWNRLAADLGEFPEAGFIHGVAALAATAALTGAAVFAATLAGNRSGI